jgi:hypothetical protein
MAQRVYDAEPLFQQVQSSTRLVIQNGNNLTQIDPLLAEKIIEIHKTINKTRDLVNDAILGEIKRREKDIAVPVSEGTISSSLDPRGDIEKTRMQVDKIANCGELSYYFQRLLYEAGIPTLRISAVIQDEAKSRVCSDHIFLVAGLDPSAKLFDPHTYKHAPALDVWWLTEKEKGLFLPMQAYIKKLKQTFQLDEQAGEYLSFEPGDYYCNNKNNFKSPTFATVEQLPPRFRNP